MSVFRNYEWSDHKTSLKPGNRKKKVNVKSRRKLAKASKRRNR